MPRLAEGEDGRVDQCAGVHSLEVLTEVLERHPARHTGQTDSTVTQGRLTAPSHRAD